MPLTWQDVAGRVEMPDYTGTSAMITKGIETLGTAVADVVGGPEQRRQAQVARELLSLKGQQDASARIADSIGALSTDVKNTQKEKDMMEFGAAQSTLEATAAEYALQGKSFNEFLQSDAYSKLGTGAKAYGGPHLSDAFHQGQQELQQQQRWGVQDAQWRQSFALQQQNAADARQARRDAASTRKIAEETAQMRLDALKRDEENRKFMATPLGRLTARVGANYADATGRQYEDKTWGELGKESGIKNYSEYKELLGSLNAYRLTIGKRPVPEGAAKALLATQIGKNRGVPSVFNEVDGFDVKDQLAMAADQYDASMREADVLVQYKNMQKQGIPFTDEQVLKDLLKVNPPNATPTLGTMPADAPIGNWGRM